jgi:uncharacterized protein with von Willebrand factor type A (vWA) domain
MSPAAARAPEGQLGHNVLQFARLLRRSGLAVGPDRVLLSLQALQHGGLDRRDDFREALAACWLDRHEQRVVFDAAFELFWRDPDIAGRMMALLLPKVRAQRAASGPKQNRRLADALATAPAPSRAEDTPPEQRLEVEAWSASERERLQRADFDTMSADEWREAKRLLSRLDTFLPPLPTRRMRRAARGRPDLRATLRAQVHAGGEITGLQWRAPRTQRPPLVVLADISGSMSRYSRMLLHFAHALSRADVRLAAFVFGTRLTDITRVLRSRDPDVAVAAVEAAVGDWGGGTRLAESLHAFNRHWAGRVLDSRTTVLLVTDGLAHGDTTGLAAEVGRLQRRCRELVWLNPLLRFDGFQPRAAGIRAMLPHVDRFVPAHNLHSLQSLARLLAAPPHRRPMPPDHEKT